MADPWYTSETEPSCPECGDSFDSEIGVRNHYTRLHEEPYPWRTTRVCQHCGDDFYREWNASNKDIYCSKSCSGKATARRTLHAWYIFEGPKGYPRWKTQNANVAVHQLLAIRNGADPHKVFGNPKFNVHHKNGMKLDNRPSNIELVDAREHGRMDRERQENIGYSHKDLLRVVEFFTHLEAHPGDSNQG